MKTVKNALATLALVLALMLVLPMAESLTRSGGDAKAAVYDLFACAGMHCFPPPGACDNYPWCDNC